jgi:hypothetical protein
MATQPLDLWQLTRGKPQIDPADLAEAVCQQAGETDLDYRTRLLIRDSVQALRSFWGDVRVDHWLGNCANRDRIEAICHEEFEKVGFPTIVRRLMDKTNPENVRQLLEQLGWLVRQDTTVYIAGSVALILPGYLSRHTDDIDFIDEVPAEIRKDHQRLHELENSYSLTLGHVQSHYFPSRWQERVHSIGVFGRLKVFRVDVYDVFLSKLFSVRQKDLDDLRMLVPQLDKDTLTRKLRETASAFLAAPRLLELAQRNWQVLYGEPLPHDPDTPTSQAAT